MTFLDESALVEEPVDISVDDDEEGEGSDHLPPGPDPLSPENERFVDSLVDKIWEFTLLFSGISMFPYQEALGRRIIQSVVSRDGATVTGEFSRQSGKTEVIANVTSSLMILLPRLAEMFPEFAPLQDFRRGLMVGCFAPVEDQVVTLFSRITDRLTSDRAYEFLEDPDIDDTVRPGSKRIKLNKCGSFAAMQTANPRAKIESKSYHLILVDESQSVDEYVLNKSISPMGAFYLATMVLTGTPDVVKGAFWKTIQHNRRQELRRGQKRSHFRFDWKHCARYNRNYSIYVRGEMLRLGEDSDEFRLNYRLEWLLERGMLVTESRMDELGDIHMEIVPEYWKSPCVAGVDLARKLDSTVVTVCFVDWDRPDELGLYDCRILNWLELHGESWEDQYFRICDFLSNYSVVAMGVDAQGIGDVAADRLTHLLPNIQIEPLMSSPADQSARWKHLQTLLQRGLISWPSGGRTRKTKVWRRFRGQMLDAEKSFRGPHMLVAAPDEPAAHDDYPDSLSCATWMTQSLSVPEVEMSSAVFAGHRRR